MCDNSEKESTSDRVSRYVPRYFYTIVVAASHKRSDEGKIAFRTSSAKGNSPYHAIIG